LKLTPIKQLFQKPCKRAGESRNPVERARDGGSRNPTVAVGQR